MGLRQKSASVAESFTALIGPEVEDERIDLTEAALTIARTGYPDLDFDKYHAHLDELADRVRSRVSQLVEPAETISALNNVLFKEEGFRGNRLDYYDARNSFLNEVLDRRLGIPITLSLVYMEVARRVGFSLVGVGMPGHFVVKHYDVEGRQIIIDPYYGGRILSPRDCQRRVEDLYTGATPMHGDSLMPVNRRQMLARMLNNLKSIYLTSRNFRKALPIVDMVLAIYPRSPEDVKQRATLRLSLGQLRGASEDLETYLKMSPDASDADEIRASVMTIRRTLAMLN